MRVLQRLCAGTSARAAVTSLRCFGSESRGPVSRSAVVARWAGSSSSGSGSGSSADARAAEAQGLVGRGMSFASGLLRDVSPSSRRTATNAAADLTVGDVPWDLCERLDFYVQYNVPSRWQVTELLRDNSIAIQSSPPPLISRSDSSSSGSTSSGSSGSGDGGASTVHGISLNCFAYKQRVKQPDSVKLLHVFLRRFNASVSNSLQIVADGQPPAPPAGPKLPHQQPKEQQQQQAIDDASTASASAPEDAEGTCQRLATQLNSAVAEITFTPSPGQPLAHGLCRAFYNTNGRFHYVIVVAVPEEEYAVSRDLMVHALASVVESRVEAAAKQT